MMLLYRFNILNDIHKLRMVVVLVLCNWRIKDRLGRTIGTEASGIHAAYIPNVAHVSCIPYIAHISNIAQYNYYGSQLFSPSCLNTL